MIQQILDKAALDPKKLFLLDALGALLSAILLGFVLPAFQSIIGMPTKELHILSFMAGCYMVYSFVCYILPLKNWRPYLLIIASANLIHCIVTAGLLLFYYESIQILGWIYFIVEIIIVVTIAELERRMARRGTGSLE